jgi:serine/threonine-protein kinase
MSHPYLIGKPDSTGQSTTDFRGGERQANHGQERRAQCVLVGESGQHTTTQLACLLRRRLRIAVLICLAGFGLFLIRNLLLSENPVSSRLDLALHSLVVALMVGLATLLWSGWRISTRQLRVIELLLFGAAGFYFLWMQVVVFEERKLLTWASAETPEAKEGVMRLAAASHSLRWFILIVAYGTLIPNTWRRCATVVGLMALVPLSLQTMMFFCCTEHGPYIGQSLLDMLIILGIGAAIAIFGSYKISELSQEALEARKLGQYHLKRRLGAGGMGEVYLGEHTLLRRTCAIKLIRPDQVADPVSLSRFEREVQAMATLTHWNTVEIYDYGRHDDGTFYYVMEYLPGLSLQDLVDRHGPLCPERAVHFLRQICSALSEAHATGLIHRDIKPSNVIASERGGVYDVAKLLDFGLVHGQQTRQQDEKLTLQGTILGSPPYMSPEQALGKDGLDARTDVYSLGGLAYFLLTGRPPFQRETAMELLVAHVHDEPAPLQELRPEVPGDVADLVMRCLRKKPEERFPDADSLELALASCSMADQWGRREAALWWREHKGAEAAARREAALVDGAA